MDQNEIMKDKLLVERNDAIDNAVWAAVLEMAAEEPDWDMQIIGQIEEFIVKILGMRGIPSCWPWEDEDETVCCLSEDACAHCPHKRGD